jgi:dissimilatory sulfite reductase (desulfoviridin) alpha/beta subunit
LVALSVLTHRYVKASGGDVAGAEARCRDTSSTGAISVKAGASKLGLEAAAFAGHSLRAGFWEYKKQQRRKIAARIRLGGATAGQRVGCAP